MKKLLVYFIVLCASFYVEAANLFITNRANQNLYVMKPGYPSQTITPQTTANVGDIAQLTYLALKLGDLGFFETIPQLELMKMQARSMPKDRTIIIGNP